MPTTGTTVRVHIERLMGEVEGTLGEVFAEVRTTRRLRPQAREAMGRKLAGVIGKLETARIWLAAGAKR